MRICIECKATRADFLADQRKPHLNEWSALRGGEGE